MAISCYIHVLNWDINQRYDGDKKWESKSLPYVYPGDNNSSFTMVFLLVLLGLIASDWPIKFWLLYQDLVVGGTGPRIIAGDFNSTRQQLDEFKLWESYGWIEVQQHANHCWQQPVVPTCKCSTVVDMMWMSPEAARMCRYVGHISMFPDHVTLFSDFAVPEKITNILTWVRPTSIPWDKINQETWHHNLGRLTAPDEVTSSSTQFFAEWAQHWEAALDECVQDQPDGHLPHTFRGRAKCTQPMKASLTSPVSKPSRQGEVQLRSDLVSTQVQQWFRQGRRLQSYKMLQACCCRQQADAGCWGLQTHLVVRHQERTWIWWIFPCMVASEKNTSAFSPCNFSTCTSWWIHCWANRLGLLEELWGLWTVALSTRSKATAIEVWPQLSQAFSWTASTQARPTGSSLAHQRLHDLGGRLGHAPDPCWSTSEWSHWMRLVRQQHAGWSWDCAGGCWGRAWTSRPSSSCWTRWLAAVPPLFFWSADWSLEAEMAEG